MKLRALLAGMALIAGVSSTARAQVDITTSFEFDNGSNRISASGLLRLTDPVVLAASPSVAFHGEVVNIFGRNLEPGVGTGYSVTFGGVSAEIVSVAPRVITVLVPQGAMSGPLVVTLPGATPVDLGSFFIRGLVISPMDARIVFSQTIQFSTDVTGAPDGTVVWELVPIPGSDPTASLGAITPDGLYTPPDIADLDLAGTLFVRATTDALNSVVAFAQIWLFGTVVPSLGIDAIILVTGDQSVLGANTTVTNPQVNVIVPVTGDQTALGANTTVAKPKVEVIVPATGDQSVLGANTTVAKPPVEVEIEN